MKGAKKEGKLMWYTSLTGGPNTEAPKVFEAKYPGVKMEVYRGDSDALISRTLQEAQAKRYLVDTIETTFPILKVMQDEKLLARYFSPYLASYPDEVKEKADKGLVYWATDRETYIGLAYNTDVVPASAAPKKFDDLLKPELKGKIGFATSDTGNRVIGAMLATKGARVRPKTKITGHNASLRFRQGDIGYGDFRRARRVTHDVFEPFARVDFKRRTDQVGAYGCCSD